MITEECMNCALCKPECPNVAIYEPDAPWKLFGETYAALSNNVYYIVPDKCTECVGFHEEPQCAAVCPVDCCVADPNFPETEEELRSKKEALVADNS
nr:ferredoxin [Chloroherpeton thalassium]